MKHLFARCILTLFLITLCPAALAEGDTEYIGIPHTGIQITPSDQWTVMTADSQEDPSVLDPFDMSYDKVRVSLEEGAFPAAILFHDTAAFCMVQTYKVNAFQTFRTQSDYVIQTVVNNHTSRYDHEFIDMKVHARDDLPIAQVTSIQQEDEGEVQNIWMLTVDHDQLIIITYIPTVTRPIDDRDHQLIQTFLDNLYIDDQQAVRTPILEQALAQTPQQVQIDEPNIVFDTPENWLVLTQDMTADDPTLTYLGMDHVEEDQYDVMLISSDLRTVATLSALDEASVHSLKGLSNVEMDQVAETYIKSLQALAQEDTSSNEQYHYHDRSDIIINPAMKFFSVYCDIHYPGYTVHMFQYITYHNGYQVAITYKAIAGQAITYEDEAMMKALVQSAQFTAFLDPPEPTRDPAASFVKVIREPDNHRVSKLKNDFVWKFLGINAGIGMILLIIGHRRKRMKDQQRKEREARQPQPTVRKPRPQPSADDDLIL